MARSDACPKCDGSKYRYARTCLKCRGNNGGRPHSPETRAKIGAAQRARIQRPRKPESEYLAGHDYARRWIPMPDLCERCGVVPPLDRHHKDGNPRNNDRSNIACLCRRCHQTVDGRIEILRANGYARQKASA
jgi:hypothetical protein